MPCVTADILIRTALRNILPKTDILLFLKHLMRWGPKILSSRLRRRDSEAEVAADSLPALNGKHAPSMTVKDISFAMPMRVIPVHTWTEAF